MKRAETCSCSLCNKLYTYFYHHIFVLDKYIHCNIVYNCRGLCVVITSGDLKWNCYRNWPHLNQWRVRLVQPFGLRSLSCLGLTPVAAYQDIRVGRGSSSLMHVRTWKSTLFDLNTGDENSQWLINTCSAVSIMTRLRDGRPRNWGSIPLRVQERFPRPPHLKRSDAPLDSSSLLFDCYLRLLFMEKGGRSVELTAI
jgi:hypothetical protein